MSQPKHAPQTWGVRSQDFYATLHNQPVLVTLQNNVKVKGVLIGLDIYDIIIRQDSGLELLIAKGAIIYVHRATL